MLETYSVSFGVAVRPICVAAGKMVENFAPGRILGGAAAMALVDDDQIEEVRARTRLYIFWRSSGPVIA